MIGWRFRDRPSGGYTGAGAGGPPGRGRVNIAAFDVGAGKVVAMGGQIAFRTQTRGAFKLLFNAISTAPPSPSARPNWRGWIDAGRGNRPPRRNQRGRRATGGPYAAGNDEGP